MGDKTLKENAEGMPIGKSEPESLGSTATSAELQQADAQKPDQIGTNSPFPSQNPSPPYHQLQDRSGSSGYSPYGSPAPHAQQHLYNLAGMAGALPDYGQPIPQGYPRQTAPRPMAGSSTPGMIYHMGQNLQYPPPAQYGTPVAYGSYGQPHYPPQYSQSPGSSPHGGYGSPYSQTPQRPPGPPPQYPQNPVQYYYYQDPYAHQAGSPTTYSPQHVQYSSPVRGGAPGIVSGQMVDSGSRRLSGGYGPPYQSASPSGDESGMFHYALLKLNMLTVPIKATRSRESATAAIPRGPPRKPKQSGHALWVGNLPPNTSIIALKDHFSRDAKREIESLFLISKSNCAFVNYRTESACERAVARFHDSRFQGVRLVCRLRKSSATAPGVPTEPSAMSSSKPPQSTSAKASREEGVDGDDDDDDDDDDNDDDNDDEPDEENEEEGDNAEQGVAESSTKERIASPAKSSERYFIVKSLTLQDLEQSVRNGIWATQSHNEDALNKAYNVSGVPTVQLSNG